MYLLSAALIAMSVTVLMMSTALLLCEVIFNVKNLNSSSSSVIRARMLCRLLSLKVNLSKDWIKMGTAIDSSVVFVGDRVTGEV